MLVEGTDFIDVEVHDQGCEALGIDESIHESIHGSDESIQWFPAAKAKYLSGSLNQSSFQRSVKELEKTHLIPLSSLRRGTARNTEYSGTAIALVKLLNSIKPSDRKAFESLKQSLLPVVSVVSDTAIVCVTGHREITVESTNCALENRGLIREEMVSLFGRFDDLADAIGDQIVARMDQRITGKIQSGIKRMGES